MTENRTIEVPVTREEGVVERVPVEGREAGQFESGQKEIRVPVSEEQVRVEKQPVVTEQRLGGFEQSPAVALGVCSKGSLLD